MQHLPTTTASSSSSSSSTTRENLPILSLSFSDIPAIPNGKYAQFHGQVKRSAIGEYEFTVEIQKKLTGGLSYVSATFDQSNVHLRLEPLFGSEEIQIDAIEYLTGLYENPKIYNYIGDGQPRHRSDVSQMQMFWQKAAEDGAFSLAFKILAKENASSGVNSVGYITIDQRGGVANATDPAYAIDPEYQGKGYASKAAVLTYGPVMSLLLQSGCNRTLYARNGMPRGICDTFEATCWNENKQSKQVLMKVMGKEPDQLLARQGRSKFLFSYPLERMINIFGNQLGGGKINCIFGEQKHSGLSSLGLFSSSGLTKTVSSEVTSTTTTAPSTCN